MVNGKDIDSIKTSKDLADFIQQLCLDVQSNPAEWENRDLPAYLEAMSAWVQDMEGYYQNQGKPFPKSPSWQTIAEILLAARLYE